MLNRGLYRVWSVLISLKFAVLVILGLAICLAIATVIESDQGIKAAQYFVYRSPWFYGLLILFGMNILAVALSRLPWKKKHIPFLLAHAGILLILLGSAVTALQGLDGNLRITEGEVGAAVELDDHVLLRAKGDDLKTLILPWLPPSKVRDYQPTEFPDFGIKIEKRIANAVPVVQFESQKTDFTAIQIRVLGSPMGGTPEFWLWSGDPAWSSQKLGPVRFLIRKESQKELSIDSGAGDAGEARFDFVLQESGRVRFETRSTQGVRKTGVLQGLEKEIVNPEWKMPIQVQVKRIVKSAANRTFYKEQELTNGQGVTSQPAILVSLLENPDSKVWLGLGDRAEIESSKGDVYSVGYYPKRVVLPFGIRLNKFEMKNNPGTFDPSAYSSFVQVASGVSEKELKPEVQISMNEPLKEGGYTFYQASYIPDFPRPTTTVLSVNRDPGRLLKYLGSLLLVMGSILLYVFKWIQTRKVLVKTV